MPALHDLKDEDLQGLAPEAVTALAQQMLQRIRQQAHEIRFKDAKIEKIMFQLAQLKAWKFGAKTEAMNAEQRRLFEETVGEAGEDIRAAVDAETEPLERLRVFTIRLHEWCDPAETPRKHGAHSRRAISEFSMHLTIDHSRRIRAALAPVSHLLVELVDAAAGVIRVADTRRATALVQQTVMYSWFGNRLVDNPRLRLTAEETWQFCLHGLTG